MSNVKQSQEHDTMKFRESEPCIEEYRNFIQRSKNVVGPEEMSSASTESFVDTLTEKEIDNLREKLFSYLEITGYEYGKAVKTSKVSRLQANDPTTQHEEAVISFEDAKSEVVSAAKSLVRQYDTEKWIEAELKDIRNSKVTEDYASTSTEDMQEAQLLLSENMDFTDLERKVAEPPEMSGLAPKQRIKYLPVLKRTDILEMLLRIYESCIVQTSEGDEAYLVKEAGDLPTNKSSKVYELRKHLVLEMKAIYEQLASIKDILSSPEDNETENLSSSSSSLKIMSLAIPPMSPLELSTSAYPEPTTRSEAISREDATMCSMPFTTTDSASGLINEPVIDIALAQAKSSTSSPKSWEDSISNTATSSTAISEESNTMSGISSLPTDPRTSVSSLRDTEPMSSISSLTSVSSLRDMETKISGDTYPRTSVSSLMDTDQRTSMFSLRDIESLVGAVSPNIPQLHLLSEDDVSDDAFLAAPLAATANTSIVDSAEMAQNPRRRSHSSKEDEDKNEAKRPAI